MSCFYPCDNCLAVLEVFSAFFLLVFVRLPRRRKPSSGASWLKCHPEVSEPGDKLAARVRTTSLYE